MLEKRLLSQVTSCYPSPTLDSEGQVVETTFCLTFVVGEPDPTQTQILDAPQTTDASLTVPGTLPASTDAATLTSLPGSLSSLIPTNTVATDLSNSLTTFSIPPATSSTLPTADANAQTTSSGLSEDVILGLGLGIPLFIAAIVVLIVWKRKNTKQQALDFVVDVDEETLSLGNSLSTLKVDEEVAIELTGIVNSKHTEYHYVKTIDNPELQLLIIKEYGKDRYQSRLRPPIPFDLLQSLWPNGLPPSSILLDAMVFNGLAYTSLLNEVDKKSYMSGHFRRIISALLRKHDDLTVYDVIAIQMLPIHLSAVKAIYFLKRFSKVLVETLQKQTNLDGIHWEIFNNTRWTAIQQDILLSTSLKISPSLMIPDEDLVYHCTNFTSRKIQGAFVTLGQMYRMDSNYVYTPLGADLNQLFTSLMLIFRGCLVLKSNNTPEHNFNQICLIFSLQDWLNAFQSVAPSAWSLVVEMGYWGVKNYIHLTKFMSESKYCPYSPDVLKCIEASTQITRIMHKLFKSRTLSVSFVPPFIIYLMVHAALVFGVVAARIDIPKLVKASKDDYEFITNTLRQSVKDSPYIAMYLNTLNQKLSEIYQ
ncbi:hypothetical protein EDD86DRAFT_244508 [Gorgonomyces haynaldii]|nr:hypothetical protein EDD86DRAFT_244508 [Gorgonomyces haynaldii]